MPARAPYTRGIIPAVLILAALGYWWLHPHSPKVIGTGYIAERSVTLWSSLAQVRQPLEDLHYGDRVDIVREEGIASQVRTASGIVGWLQDTRQLMDPALWQQSASLLTRARTMPVQARGQTKTVSNVRVEPGRNGRRIFQFTRGTQVLILSRTIADAPQTTEEIASTEKSANNEMQPSKQEDWLFVMRADTPSLKSRSETASREDRSSGGSADSGQGLEKPAAAASPAVPMAGWILARFIEVDLPGPLRDYATAADLHVMAWFELNRVPDGSGGETSQYLVAASRVGQGQVCDFTMLRVYTWGAKRKRYETAYVESDLCGRLPVKVSSTPNGAQFRFAEIGGSAPERTYIMQQTAVHRVKDDSGHRR